jgi:septal ring factor EnvC (AmiA/AmiB activator)
MVDIQNDLKELKSIHQESRKLRLELKQLNDRKKELEKNVMDYLEEKEKPGLKFENIVFLATEKNARGRKKKTDVVQDTVKVLQSHGIDDPIGVLRELDEARKGVPNSVPVLKMKAAGIYD